MSKSQLLSIRGQIGPYGKHHPHLGTVVFTGHKNHGHLVITGEVKATDAIKNELARRKPAIDDVVPRLASGARPFVMGGRLGITGPGSHGSAGSGTFMLALGSSI